MGDRVGYVPEGPISRRSVVNGRLQATVNVFYNSIVDAFVRRGMDARLARSLANQVRGGTFSEEAFRQTIKTIVVKAPSQTSLPDEEVIGKIIMLVFHD